MPLFTGLSEIVEIAHTLTCHLHQIPRIWGVPGGKLWPSWNGSKAVFLSSLTPVTFPLPASPGPSLEVPDKLLFLSPFAHPELMGDDVAGMDTALGTGPVR